MKNYYYFLGINPNSTDKEIKHAYRKLSNKYHPDKNNQDAFFTQRFLDLKEAYDVLSDHQKRQLYDANYSQFQRGVKTQATPKITQFRSNQIRATLGQKIVLSWFTENADLVKLLPIGLVNAQGETTYEITKFENHEMAFILHATNTFTQKTVVERIIIHQHSILEKKEIIESEDQENIPILSQKPHGFGVGKLIFIIVFCVIIILIFAIVLKTQNL